jgi:hypothetical protein
MLPMDQDQTAEISSLKAKRYLDVGLQRDGQMDAHVLPLPSVTIQCGDDHSGRRGGVASSPLAAWGLAWTCGRHQKTQKRVAALLGPLVLAG